MLIRRSLAAVFLFAVAVVFLNPGCSLPHPGSYAVSTSENEFAVTHVTLRRASPNRLAAGHVLFASIGTSHAGAPFELKTPDGWTLIKDARGVSQTNGVRLLTFYKIAGASEPLAYDFKLTVPGGGGGPEPTALMSGILVSVFYPGRFDSALLGGATTPELPPTGARRFAGAIFLRDAAGNYTTPAGWRQERIAKAGTERRGHTQYVITRGIDAGSVPPVTVINDAPATVTVSQVLAFR